MKITHFFNGSSSLPAPFPSPFSARVLMWKFTRRYPLNGSPFEKTMVGINGLPTFLRHILLGICWDRNGFITTICWAMVRKITPGTLHSEGKYSSGTIPLFSETLHPQVCFQELLTILNPYELPKDGLKPKLHRIGWWENWNRKSQTIWW